MLRRHFHDWSEVFPVTSESRRAQRRNCLSTRRIPSSKAIASLVCEFAEQARIAGRRRHDMALGVQWTPVQRGPERSEDNTSGIVSRRHICSDEPS